jgi:anthranilate synthase component II
VKTLLVDAFDSFIHIVDQYLRVLGCDTEVVRSGVTTPDQVAESDYDLVVLGPGPGHPADSGHVELVHRLAGQVPIFGICLGHQAIGLAFGGEVNRAGRLIHGKTSRLDHDGTGVFAGLPADLEATRYHSLIVEETNLPPELEISARSVDDGFVMALRHITLDIESVQFHPESVKTQNGLRMLGNVVANAAGPAGIGRPAAA